jgi:hypothetical protein
MMVRYPEFIPLSAGVFALANERRKFVYVSFTQNLQKRSHSMSHMLLQYDGWLASSNPTPKGAGKPAPARRAKTMPYWPIRDMPKRPSDEFIFVAVPYRGADALGEVERLQDKYRRRGYKIIAGHRAASGMVRLEGRLMKLSAAVAAYSDEAYLTVYRRLQRGWSVRQALGLDPPAPRWHTAKQQARKARAAERAAA